MQHYLRLNFELMIAGSCCMQWRRTSFLSPISIYRYIYISCVSSYLYTSKQTAKQNKAGLVVWCGSGCCWCLSEIKLSYRVWKSLLYIRHSCRKEPDKNVCVAGFLFYNQYEKGSHYI